MCNNINYWAKNRVVMFYCGLQTIARFISTRPTSTRIGWRVKKKYKNVIHRPGSVSIWRNCALDLSIALGLRSREVLKTSGTASPNTDLPAGV